MRSAILALTLLLPAFAFAEDPTETRLLRYPDIHGDAIAFVYGGDIWVAPAQGGAARRLTSDPGEELFPKLSPDGKWIAFTGQLSGTRQVHVISVDGQPVARWGDLQRRLGRGGRINLVYFRGTTMPGVPQIQLLEARFAELVDET